MTGPANFKVKPWRSAPYRRFVATLPCANPRCRAKDTVAHHENAQGHSTMAGKCCDSRTVPLCVECHLERHLCGRTFWLILGIDPEQVITATQERWYERYKTRPWEK